MKNSENAAECGLFRQGLIWFGAAISVAEIEAGLQAGANVAALVLGHLVGGILLFAAGLLGARTGENAMETTNGTFGSWGMRLFALLNGIQLVGWTTVMISQGAGSVSALGGWPLAPCIFALACLVAIWVLIGLDNTHHLATIAMVLLASLACILTIRLAGLPTVPATTEPLGFWSAFEISVAMPLSWLPLISDYTRRSARPVAGTAVAAAVYTLISCWMYAIGLLLALAGAKDLTAGILACGLGGVGLAVVTISTMTTTFLDAFSAGESAKVFSRRLNPRIVGLAVCAAGAVLAVSGLVDRYVDFLYLIASVFAPMAAVLLTDRYLLCRSSTAWNVGAWALGTLTYHFAGSSPIGPTLTSLLVAGGVTLCQGLCRGSRRDQKI